MNELACPFGVGDHDAPEEQITRGVSCQKGQSTDQQMDKDIPEVQATILRFESAHDGSNGPPYGHELRCPLIDGECEGSPPARELPAVLMVQADRSISDRPDSSKKSNHMCPVVIRTPGCSRANARRRSVCGPMNELTSQRGA